MNRPRARARPRARMAQLGLIRSSAPGIDQDRCEAVSPWLSLMLPETALFFSEISLAHSRDELDDEDEDDLLRLCRVVINAA